MSWSKKEMENVIKATFEDYNLGAFFVQSLSHIWLFATPRTAERQASLSFTICQI